jgi:hypothetical protein
MVLSNLKLFCKQNLLLQVDQLSAEAAQMFADQQSERAQRDADEQQRVTLEDLFHCSMIFLNIVRLTNLGGSKAARAGAGGRA